MENILNQTAHLKELLSKFINIVYLDDVELERIYNFIFRTEPVPDVVEGDQFALYQTLDFLRDMAHDGNFSSATELLDYFVEQDAVWDNLIESEMKSIQGSHSFDLSILEHFYMEPPAIKLLGCQHAEPMKQYEQVVDHLYQFLSSHETLRGIENSYQEISSTNTKHTRDVFRACSLHALLLPNTDDIHFDHYYRAFAPKKKTFMRVMSLLKRCKAWFSRLPWKKIRNDIERERRERNRVKSMYEKIIECVRAEQPIENKEVQTMLSKIMMIAKFNNPAFMAQHDSSARHLYKQYCHFIKKKRWAVLKSPSGHGWHTTDNPGISIDVDMPTASYHHTYADPYWKSVSDKSIIFFPLSHEYCLRLMPENNAALNPHVSYIGFEKSSEHEFQVINKLAIASEPNVLISAEGIRKRMPTRSCCAAL